MPFLFVLALLSIAFAAPTPATNSATCNAKIEETPWTITNLLAFEATPGKDSSFVSFYFCDTNSGLELQTTCSWYLQKGAGGSPIDAATYHFCDNKDVQFIYAGNSLTIDRSYEDPCIGEPPYDGVDAFGTADTNLVSTTSANGNTFTQAEMTIQITAES